MPGAIREPSAGELLAHLQGLPARCKLPRSLLLVPELPRGATGKLLKGPLRYRYGSTPTG
ncbi:hypothetical protein [Streptomyces sp. NPDC014656]|uniref:hypothetical protein n=1 Tax=Streptomyces sp. NPDC014656 TaxID=3364878 RepID=UPI0036FA4A91